MFVIYFFRICYFRYYSVFKIHGGLKLESLNAVFGLYFRLSVRFVPSILFPLVGSSGLEPPTSRLSGVRSNHLSYEPICGIPVRRTPDSLSSPFR